MSMAMGDDKPTTPRLDAGGKSSEAARFRVAPTFIVDLSVSFVYAVFLGRLWNGVHDKAMAMLVAAPFIGLIMLCYLGKILVIRFLERRGGDARTYVLSNALVTDGPYAWSRNPTYLLALIQFLLWSALLLVLQAFGTVEALPLAVACLAPLIFFVLTDRVNIAREDKRLAAKHPEAFAEYSKRVGRWIGRLS